MSTCGALGLCRHATVIDLLASDGAAAFRVEGDRHLVHVPFGVERQVSVDGFAEIVSVRLGARAVGVPTRKRCMVARGVRGLR